MMEVPAEAEVTTQIKVEKADGSVRYYEQSSTDFVEISEQEYNERVR